MRDKKGRCGYKLVHARTNQFNAQNCAHTLTHTLLTFYNDTFFLIYFINI